MPKKNRFNVVAVLLEKERQGERALSGGNSKQCAFILSNHLIVLTYFIGQKHQINRQASPQQQNISLPSFPFNYKQDEARQNSQALETVQKIGLAAWHHGIHHLLVSIKFSESSQYGARQADTLKTPLFWDFLLHYQLGLTYSEASDNAPSKKTDTNYPQARKHSKTHQNTQELTTEIQYFEPSSVYSQMTSYAHQFVLQLSKLRQTSTPSKPKQLTTTSPHEH